jgi:predicted DNA-binding protein
MSDFVRFSLRIPNETHEYLKILADKDDRSLNNYIVKVLDNHVKNNIGMPRNKNERDGKMHININLDNE